MKQQAGRNVSMTNMVLESLRDDINNCTYESGQFITESEISQKFHVSKTPAREALNFLCQEGLLEKVPRKGYVVKRLSLAEVQHLLEFRNILERAAVEWAIRYATTEELQALLELAHRKLDPQAENLANRYNDLNVSFHISVANLTRNPYLINALQNTLNLLRRDLYVDMRQNSMEKALGAHVWIAEAMLERDLEKALQLTSEQLEAVGKRLFPR